MRRSVFMLPLLAALLFTTACSKDKRIERHLVSREGKWKIKTFTSTAYLNQTVEDSETINDAGYMVFEKNGAAVIALTYMTQDQVLGGSWANTKDELYIVAGGTGLTFSIKDESRKEMTLENTQYDSDSTSQVIIFKIEKEK